MENDVKQKIADTVKELLFKKSIDKITVKEIVITAGISRQAFYYHFSDTLEVMEWIYERELPKIVDMCDKIEDVGESMHLFAENFMLHYPVISKLLNSKRRSEAEHILLSAVRRYFFLLSERIYDGNSLMPDERDFLIEFASCGFMAYFSEKCLNGEKIDAEFFSNEIYKLMISRLKHK